MGVSTEYVEHNINNSTLSEGARKLGYSHKMVPQNTGGNKHYCGYCTLGCGAAEKQGPVMSFLPDADKAGAQFIEGFEAEKALFETMGGNKTATAVKGRWVSRDSSGGVSGNDRTFREVIIKAKRVIVSSGTLQSPLLLQRSGLTNPHIGKNLHLHPVVLLSAIYPDQPPIKPWEGAILTTVVDEFQNLDGHGHGAKLECMTMLPSWVLPFQSWEGALDWKLLCSKLPHMTSHIVLVRDRESGRVYPDPVDGKCRVAYTPSAFDKRHAMEGLLALARIAYVQGAKEIFTTTVGFPPFIRSDDAALNDNGNGINDPVFQSWLADVRKAGLSPPETGWGSAHQMGTCRMAATPKAGVVDPKGKVWGTERLYVADASVFPSASGVNPMITNMAISDWISRGIARDLSGGADVEERARL
jgi:choline dehydrogenase-like flavoprotein